MPLLVAKLDDAAQALGTEPAEAFDPFVDGLPGGVELARGLGLGEPAIHDGEDHVLSTSGRKARIVVGVHSVRPPRITDVWRHQLRETDRMDNLLQVHT